MQQASMLNSLAFTALWVASVALCASATFSPPSPPSLSISDVFNGSFPRYHSASFVERSPSPGSISGDGLCNSTYLGCFEDNTNTRALDGAFGVHNAMTGEMCIGFCAGLGYIVAGTEWSTQCFCSRSIRGLVARPESECNMPCAGNSTQACGGPVRLSVYADSPDDPITNPGDGETFEYAGCWTDRVSDRTLPSLRMVAGGPSVSTCATVCRAGGFTYAGVEYAGECWCGNDLSKATIRFGESDATGCNMPCRTNQSEFCGGPDRLNVYRLPPIQSATLTVASSSSITSFSSGNSSDSTSSPAMTTTTDASSSSTTDRVPDDPITVSSPTSSETSGPSTVPTHLSPALTSDTPASTPIAAPPFGNSSAPVTSTTSSLPSETTEMTSLTTITVTPSFSNSSPSSTDTDLPSMSTSSPSPTENSTSPTPSTVSPRNIILNGGFEGFDTIYDVWRVTPNQLITNTGNLHNYTDPTLGGGRGDPYAHTGLQAFVIYDDDVQDDTTRSLCISQTAYHPGAGHYNISAYIGRALYTGPFVGGSKGETMLYQIFVDDVKVKDGDVCDPSQGECTVPDVNGHLSYDFVTYEVMLPAFGIGNHTLSICVVFVGSTEHHDDFLVDDVSSFGPY